MISVCTTLFFSECLLRVTWIAISQRINFVPGKGSTRKLSLYLESAHSLAKPSPSLHGWWRHLKQCTLGKIIAMSLPLSQYLPENTLKWQKNCCRNCQERGGCHLCALYITWDVHLFQKGKQTNNPQLFTKKSTVDNPCISTIPSLTQPEPIWWPCLESCIIKSTKPNCISTGN